VRERQVVVPAELATAQARWLSISSALLRWRGNQHGPEDAMKYALLLYADPDKRQDAVIADGAIPTWIDYTRALKESGSLVAAEHLFDIDTATSVRHNGERVLTDGPFAETKEHLLGLFLIDVPDLDAALDWAAKMPFISYGTVEVRAARTGMPWQAVLDE
jgi:hypothetical protein